MKVLKVVEHCTLENMDLIKLIKFKKGKPYYVGTSKLTNKEFMKWAGTKSKKKLTAKHTLKDRVDVINEMIRKGIYMFGNFVLDIPYDIKVDIGSGPRPKYGYLSLDSNASCKPDILRDLEKGLPFSDGVVSDIHASHVLEHIRDLVFLMEECYRVLKIGGRMTIVVPMFPGKGSIKDPTHVRYFIPESFDYFDLDWKYRERTDVTKAKFKVFTLPLDLDDGYPELHVTLLKIK